jgi:putative aldouronate transport system permease protein
MTATKGQQMMNEKGGNRIVDFVNTGCIIVFIALCLVPLFHIASVSLSSNKAIMSGEVTLFPIGIDFEAYKRVLQDDAMLRSLILTVILTVAFTFFCMLMTIAAAFPLTKRGLRGRKVFMFLIVFTMFFSGGTIPEYLLIKDLHLTNNLWSLILPSMINPFFLIILITFFRSIPQSLSEAAEIDGNSHFGTLFRIILPLSMPALATLSLFYAVGRWNGFMDALMYISNPQLYPIQLKLYQIVMNSMMSDTISREGDPYISVMPESLKAASIMFATVPILIVYPWLQRYFISGVMLGSVKE